MPVMRDIHVEGIPKYVPDDIAEEFRGRVAEALHDLLHRSGMKNLSVSVATSAAPIAPPPAAGLEDAATRPSRSGDEATIEERAEQYESREPLFDFDFLVISDEAREGILSAADLIHLEEQVFDRWNLRSIEPYPRTALNFHGPPGTGKTLAAHAVASYLKKPILLVSYAQVESKYVGDGSKNIEAIFFAAQREGAVLFVDEADSLLSRRLTEVTQGAEQAINSMRSQLLLCLERYSGVVVFSTNLVQNYDRAFETRMRHLYFPMPDEAARAEIWRRHLPEQLPLGEGVSPVWLSKIEDLCGRDIKNAVIDAALRAARSGESIVTREGLTAAVERLKEARLGD